MRTFLLLVAATVLGVTSLQIHSQSKPTATSGAALIQIKTGNDGLIVRQAATLEILKAMETDTNLMRITAKRK